MQLSRYDYWSSLIQQSMLFLACGTFWTYVSPRLNKKYSRVLAIKTECSLSALKKAGCLLALKKAGCLLAIKNIVTHWLSKLSCCLLAIMGGTNRYSSCNEHAFWLIGRLGRRGMLTLDSSGNWALLINNWFCNTWKLMLWGTWRIAKVKMEDFSTISINM